VPDTIQTTDAPGDASSRRRFLQLAGGGGATAAAAFLAACGGDKKTAATAATMTKTASAGNVADIAILNYALTLEHLETDFYAKVVDSGLLKGKELEFAKHVGETERQHVAALSGTIQKLGGKPVAAPKTKFPLESRKAVLELAATVENLGAAAYLGKAPDITSPEVLAAALSIHSVEARHAAALNSLLGKSPTPNGAFGMPATEKQVLAAVQPFIVS
jgi:rubrerythrin